MKSPAVKECFLRVFDKHKEQVSRLVIASDFARQQIISQPECWLDLVESGQLDQIPSRDSIRRSLLQCLSQCNDEESLLVQLRRFRNKQQLGIIWRDVNRIAELHETCDTLSFLADACVDLTYQWFYSRLCEQYGVPIGSVSGKPQHMIVLGMGKLGALELNLSSDIDLIFAYPETGETRGCARSLSNQDFFVRLGQKLIKSLDAVTSDGLVFRVDMRLRPYGSAGALVFSFNALESYYQTQGRTWERYAMIKARVVAGDQLAGQQLLDMLQPFIYRRYLDFSAIESLRSMKALIQQEVQRKGLLENIKLGFGGIREIEFIVQTFQLIHGGRDIKLQNRSLISTLELLKKHYLPDEVVEQLHQAYIFLRYTEHALQALNDQQTQNLPLMVEEQSRLAFSLGFCDWSEFYQTLNGWRNCVHQHFNLLIAEPNTNAHKVNLDDASMIDRSLKVTNFKDIDWAIGQLYSLRQSSNVKAMQRLGRARLDLFVPRLMCLISQQEKADLVLLRVIPLIETIARRSMYLVLLTENIKTLERLLVLCAKSAWIADELAHFPLLLDELLHYQYVKSPPSPAELKNELRERLSHIPEDDLEQQMDALRYFKLTHRLRLSISEIMGFLPLMKVSDYLTWVAEVILDQVFCLSWQYVCRKYGEPVHYDLNEKKPAFVVVGYGKLGGLELGHNSDLDVVFIYDAADEFEVGSGIIIDSRKFFTRLSQRMIHLLTVQMYTGKLYEVDVRLRPSGESGLLVSSLEAFQRYQLNDAWTWEHQALVRARCIVGDSILSDHFSTIRQKVLAISRDTEFLRDEVSRMRQKMRTHLSQTSDTLFDIKQDAGGMIDIEFIVQYSVLAWSCQDSHLMTYTDNMRILDELKTINECSLSERDIVNLQNTYQAYRSFIHRKALQNEAAVVSSDQFYIQRCHVLKAWELLKLY
ncbi:UNVERIFIED_CONTAM: hypothetical protein GTU68_000686 [Idotea baltica]|nr:hypothetical protein [Idotea baltica]